MHRLAVVLLAVLGAFVVVPPARAVETIPDDSSCATSNLLGTRLPASHDNARGDLGRVTDGAVGPEGAPWDDAVAVTFRGHGTLVYDFGAPVEIRALYAQADANDSYRVEGSLDGGEGGFFPVTEIGGVLERGHGLRARTAEFAAVKLRFLRLSTGLGDGAFSIAELAAFCRAPRPFPPAVRVIGPTPQRLEPNQVAPAERGTVDGSRAALLVLAAALVLLGLFGRRGAASAGERRAGSSGNAGAQRKRRGVERPEATGLSHASERASERRRDDERTLRWMFLASGAAALVYEVVWLHLLRLVIGASALSVGIVLASFMGGMFLGSLFYSRVVRKSEHPLRVYALLEIGIGVFGLLMPVLLPAIRSVYVEIFGYGPLGIALRALVATLALLPPTALMGATLPAIARRYSEGRRSASNLGWLYAANTIGAVVGSSIAAFYLLARFDVWVATLAAVVTNFLVAAAALRGARTIPPRFEAGATAKLAPPVAESLHVDARLIYLGVALSGLSALGAQVLWTRLLTLLFGATVFAFAIILAVFLGGLGFGSALASALLRRGQNALRGFAVCQLLLVPALFLSSFVLSRILPYAAPPAVTPVNALHGLHVLRAIDVILPSAVLWGMSFPFALAAANAGSADTGRTSGLAYASNTVGAIAGALVVSFWIIPSYGSLWAGKVLVLTAGLSAALLFYALGRTPAPALGGRRPFSLHPAWALGAGVLGAAFVPGLSPVFLAHGRYIWWVDARDEYPYVSEGAASTVAVHIAPDGYKNFHVSGRVEATNNPADLRTSRLIGHLSGLPHPRPESVLVVGLGGGISAGALTLYPEVRRIVICEIEPRVAGAARLFAKENYDVLDDPRVELVFDDARHYLATTSERFDVITSDPIHPWVRGNSILFSREYYEIVKTRLRPGGLATQWVPLYETSELAIKIQMRTFMDAFPHGTVWNTSASGRGYDVVLVGSERPLRLEVAAMQRRLEGNPRLLESLRGVRIDGAVDLLATYGASGVDMRSWLEGVPVNRDFSLKLEYISGLALNRGEADPIYHHMVANRSYPGFIASDAVEKELRRRLGL